MRGFQARVARDNDAVFIHDYRVFEAEVADAVGDHFHRRVVFPRVVLVGFQVADFYILHLCFHVVKGRRRTAACRPPFYLFE